VPLICRQQMAFSAWVFPGRGLLHLQVKGGKLQRVVLRSLLSYRCHACLCGGMEQMSFSGRSGVLVSCSVSKALKCPLLVERNFRKWLSRSSLCFFKGFCFCYTYKDWLAYMLCTSARQTHRKAKGPGNRLSQHTRRKGQFSLHFL